jgi:hypothetical protein
MKTSISIFRRQKSQFLYWYFQLLAYVWKNIVSDLVNFLHYEKKLKIVEYLHQCKMLRGV